MLLEKETTDVADFHRMVDGKGLRNPEKVFGGKEQVVFSLPPPEIHWPEDSVSGMAS